MTITNPIEKILSVSTDDDNQCWLWPYRNSELYKASWEAHHAMPVPPGMVVRHICDQGRCVNPFHLTIGTQLENQIDRVNRTETRKRGSFLSNYERYEIMTTEADIDELSSRFNVSERLVKILRKHWLKFTPEQREKFKNELRFM